MPYDDSEDDDEERADLAARVKQLQRDSEESKQQWWAFCDAEGHSNRRDPNRHTVEFLRRFFEARREGRIPAGRTTPAPPLEDPEMHKVWVQRIKQAQRSSQDLKAKWEKYCDYAGGGVRDPQRHTSEFMQRFFDESQNGLCLWPGVAPGMPGAPPLPGVPGQPVWPQPPWGAAGAAGPWPGQPWGPQAAWGAWYAYGGAMPGGPMGGAWPGTPGFPPPPAPGMMGAGPCGIQGAWGYAQGAAPPPPPALEDGRKKSQSRSKSRSRSKVKKKRKKFRTRSSSSSRSI